MPITRAESKKNPNSDNTSQYGGIEIAPIVHSNKVQSSASKHIAPVLGTEAYTYTHKAQLGIASVNNNMSHLNKNPPGKSTPEKGDKGDKPPRTPSAKTDPKKAKSGPYSNDNLAELIKTQGEEISDRFDKVEASIQDVKADVSGLTLWQAETDERLTKLEETDVAQITTTDKLATDLKRIDLRQAAKDIELKTLREKVNRITEQLIETQAVLKKSYFENNQNGRTLRSYNIRIGNLAEPLAPDRRGTVAGRKPREDTKHLVSEFIVETGIYDSLDVDEVKAIIDIAYRTGKPERNKVRNVFVKFKCIDDRNAIMRAGKIKERDNNLQGKYLMDDHTAEDYSQKQRCHALMKDLKDKDKRPHFMGGRLRTVDGFIKNKTIREFNIKHKVQDKRRTEVSTDRLNMYLSAKDAKNKDVIEEAAEEEKQQQAEAAKEDSAAGGD